MWLWVAMDATTKLMPVLQLGPRKHEVAYTVVHTLKAMLAPGCTPAFTSDGSSASISPFASARRALAKGQPVSPVNYLIREYSLLAMEAVADRHAASAATQKSGV